MELEFYDPEIYDLDVGFVYGKKRRAEFYSNEAQRINGNILELGCGTGDIVIALAQRGIDVTGLDISNRMLDRAAMKLAKEPQEIRSRAKLIHGDMETFDIPDQFSGIFMPYGTLLHLTSSEALDNCFRNIFAHLRPSGELIFDVLFPDPVYLGSVSGKGLRGFKFASEIDIPDGSCQAYVHEDYEAITQLLTGTFRYELLNSCREVTKTWYRTLTLRVVSPEELRLHLLFSGFSAIKIWGGFEHQAQLDPTEDVVIQAKKVCSGN